MALGGLLFLFGSLLGGDLGVTIDAPISTISVAAPAPTVVVGVSVQAPAAGIELAAQAPTVATGAAVFPGVVDATLAVLTPAVATGSAVFPGAAAITLEPLAPTLLQDAIISPPVVPLALVGVAPTVPPPAAVFAPFATFSLATQEPVILAARVVLVPAASLVLDTAAPVISTSIQITPGAGAVTLAGVPPSLGLAPAVVVPQVTFNLLGRVPIVAISAGDYAVVAGVQQADYSLAPAINAVPVADGLFSVFSRRYGYTYGHFDVYPLAYPGPNAVIPARVDPSIVLSEVEVSTLASKVTITFGDVLHDLNNGTGTRLYKGTILLSNGCTLQEAYQYLQWITRDSSTTNLNGVPGWAYRRLNPTYPDSPAAPFGVFVEGVFYVAQGWLLLGATLIESDRYRLVSHDGVVQVPPNAVAITIGNLAAGDQVLVGRALGDTILRDEFTPVPTPVGATSLTVVEEIGYDVPATGVIRIRGRRYTYAGVSRSTRTFGGISPPLVLAVATQDDVFVPFLDKTAAGPTEAAVFTFLAPFDARVFVRNGTVSPIVPFTATVLVTQDGAAVNVSRTTDL